MNLADVRHAGGIELPLRPDQRRPQPAVDVGHFAADPLLVQQPDDGGDGWGDDPETPDVDEGVNDDFGDLRLASGSPCIDAGDNYAVPADTLDWDGDGDTGEPMPFDLGGQLRFVDDPETPDTGNPSELGPPVVDMGAYEYQLPGDCDWNGRVNLIDYAGLVACVGGPDVGIAAECVCPDANDDGHVDLRDFAGIQVRFSHP